MSAKMPCKECGATGKIVCPVCKGTKKDPRDKSKPCSYCNGNGKAKCNFCDGSGRVPYGIR